MKRQSCSLMVSTEMGYRDSLENPSAEHMDGLRKRSGGSFPSIHSALYVSPIQPALHPHVSAFLRAEDLTQSEKSLLARVRLWVQMKQQNKVK